MCTGNDLIFVVFHLYFPFSKKIGEQAILLDNDDVCIIFHLPSRHAMEVGLTATNIAAQQELEKNQLQKRRRQSKRYSTFTSHQSSSTMYNHYTPPVRTKSSSFQKQSPALSSMNGSVASTHETRSSTLRSVRSRSDQNDYESTPRNKSTSLKITGTGRTITGRTTAVSEGDVHVDGME